MNTQNDRVTPDSVTAPQEPVQATLLKVIEHQRQVVDALGRSQDTADDAAVLKLLEAIEGHLKQLRDAGTLLPIWPAVDETGEGSFGSLIRAARLRKGLAATLVGERIGLNPQSPGLTLVERGLRKLSLDRVPELARQLDLDPLRLTTVAIRERYPRVYETLFAAPGGWSLKFYPVEPDTCDPDKNGEADLTSPF